MGLSERRYSPLRHSGGNWGCRFTKLLRLGWRLIRLTPKLVVILGGLEVVSEALKRLWEGGSLRRSFFDY